MLGIAIPVGRFLIHRDLANNASYGGVGTDGESISILGETELFISANSNLYEYSAKKRSKQY